MRKNNLCVFKKKTHTVYKVVIRQAEGRVAGIGLGAMIESICQWGLCGSISIT